MKKKLIISLTVALTIAISAYVAVNAYDSIISDSYDSISNYKSIEKTPLGLEKYKQSVMEKNKKIKVAKLNDIIATITFDTPISIEELESYINKHNITPVQIQARALQTEGTRVTIASKTTKGFKETDSIIQNQVAESNQTFVGYTGMYARINYNKIDNIQADKITYLVDTSGDMFFAGKQQIDGKQRNKMSNKLSKRFPHALTWDLEDIRNK